MILLAKSMLAAAGLAPGKAAADEQPAVEAPACECALLCERQGPSAQELCGCRASPSEW